MFRIAIKVYEINKALFNLTYLADAVSGIREAEVFQASSFDPVLFQEIKDSTKPDEWTRQAVVMPLRKG